MDLGSCIWVGLMSVVLAAFLGQSTQRLGSADATKLLGVLWSAKEATGLA